MLAIFKYSREKLEDISCRLQFSFLSKHLSFLTRRGFWFSLDFCVLYGTLRFIYLCLFAKSVALTDIMKNAFFAMWWVQTYGIDLFSYLQFVSSPKTTSARKSLIFSSVRRRVSTFYIISWPLISTSWLLTRCLTGFSNTFLTLKEFSNVFSKLGFTLTRSSVS